MIISGTVEGYDKNHTVVLLHDGSKAWLPWESMTKTKVDFASLKVNPPLAQGEEILAMVRSQVQAPSNVVWVLSQMFLLLGHRLSISS